MNENTALEENLKKTLEWLNDSANKIVGTCGYTEEVDKIRLLEELIKEQLKNENISHSISTPR